MNGQGFGPICCCTVTHCDIVSGMRQPCEPREQRSRPLNPVFALIVLAQAALRPSETNQANLVMDLQALIPVLRGHFPCTPIPANTDRLQAATLAFST